MSRIRTKGQARRIRHGIVKARQWFPEYPHAGLWGWAAVAQSFWPIENHKYYETTNRAFMHTIRRLKVGTPKR
jgi:hypothetical protein